MNKKQVLYLKTTVNLKLPIFFLVKRKNYSRMNQVKLNGYMFKKFENKHLFKQTISLPTYKKLSFTYFTWSILETFVSSENSTYLLHFLEFHFGHCKRCIGRLADFMLLVSFQANITLKKKSSTHSRPMFPFYSHSLFRVPFFFRSLFRVPFFPFCSFLIRASNSSCPVNFRKLY